MAEVGQRPQQFNPIQREFDNTDDLERQAAAAANRYARRSISDFTGFRDPATSNYSVPPMTPRSTSGESGDGGNSGE